MRKEIIQGIMLVAGFSLALGLLFVPDEFVPGLFVSPNVETITEQGKPQARNSLISLNKWTNGTSAKANNPLFTEYTKRAQELGINLEFTGVVRALAPYDGRLNHDTLELELFCEKEKSLDVLLVGDSTMAWGVIPSVIEQRSGLRVGMFAMRSMYLNSAAMRTVARLQKRYLKEGGITLFGFAIWTQLQEPEIVRRGELRKLIQYSEEEFERFIRTPASSCNVTAEPEVLPEPRLFSKASLEAHSADLNLLRKDLRKSIAGLRETSLAGDFRSLIHPSWFNAKTGKPERTQTPDQTQEQTASDKKTPSEKQTSSEEPFLKPNQFGDYRERISLNGFQFIRWDHQTLTATGPFPVRSIPSNVPPDTGFQPARDQQINANALLDLPGRKAFIITIYSEHRSYAIQRSIYAKLYKDQLDLVDLGKMHPEDRGFAMDNEGHPANLGGLEKSLLIAEWLRNNFRRQK